MHETDAFEIFKEYVRIGRGHNGGLIAASRDMVTLSQMLMRSHKFVKLLVVLLDGVGEVDGETTRVRELARRWLEDYARAIDKEG